MATDKYQITGADAAIAFSKQYATRPTTGSAPAHGLGDLPPQVRESFSGRSTPGFEFQYSEGKTATGSATMLDAGLVQLPDGTVTSRRAAELAGLIAPGQPTARDNTASILAAQQEALAQQGRENEARQNEVTEGHIDEATLADTNAALEVLESAMPAEVRAEKTASLIESGDLSSLADVPQPIVDSLVRGFTAWTNAALEGTVPDAKWSEMLLSDDERRDMRSKVLTSNAGAVKSYGAEMARRLRQAEYVEPMAAELRALGCRVERHGNGYAVTFPNGNTMSLLAAVRAGHIKF